MCTTHFYFVNKIILLIRIHTLSILKLSIFVEINFVKNGKLKTARKIYEKAEQSTDKLEE